MTNDALAQSGKQLLTKSYNAGVMRLAVSIFVLLVGCNAPGPDYRGIEARRVSVAGSTFDVRVKGRSAEAIRVNRQYAPRLGPLGARAAMAMQIVSGCRVTKIKGDAAVVHGTLRCGKDDPPAMVVAFPKNVELDCYAIDSVVSAATNQRITDYDCDVISD